MEPTPPAESKPSGGSPRKSSHAATLAAMEGLEDQMKLLSRLVSRDCDLDSAMAASDEAMMSKAEQEAKLEAQKKMIRDSALAALEMFDDLTEEEKEDPRYQGDIQHYSDDAQKQRLNILNDKQIKIQLRRWWNFTKLYDDKDHDLDLDQEEYARFHKRLTRLITEDDPEVTEEEAGASMEADFKADAGEDGQVSRGEFQNGIFQLADQWCASIDTEEYLQFLKRGFQTVYGNLIHNDALQFPPEWKKFEKGMKKVSPMNLQQTIELINMIYLKKVEADDVDDARAKQRDTMPDYVVEILEQKHGKGSKLMVKKMKSLMMCMRKYTTPEASHPWVVLFTRMCGCYVPSGRIVALPEACSNFMCDVLERVKELERDTREKVLTEDLENMIQAQGFVGGRISRKLFLQSVKAMQLQTGAKLHPSVIDKADNIFECDIAPIVDKNGDGIPDVPNDDGDEAIVGLVLITHFCTLVCDLWEMCYTTVNGKLPPGAVQAKGDVSEGDWRHVYPNRVKKGRSN